jgi:hypothetical protein
VALISLSTVILIVSVNAQLLRLENQAAQATFAACAA